MTPREWRAWLPELAIAAVVALFGLGELRTMFGLFHIPVVSSFVVLGTTVAVLLCRHYPGTALGVLWATCGIQLLGDADLMLAQLGIAVVAFGTARWGNTTTVWLSVLSIPVGSALVVLIAATRGIGGLGALRGPGSLATGLGELPTAGWVTVAGLVVAGLGVPWLSGLAVRLAHRARTSRISQAAAEEDAAQAIRESEQAREIARLQESQARFARDVHDVVGHSLAVILAQAESAQYLDDTDVQGLKTTMANIAGSARSSLQDVRRVLSETPPDAQPSGLDDLVDGVRASGHEVVTSDTGVPRPLPPELELVAFRVQQEMLTNAIKHGRRDEPVLVERAWDDELRIQVRNTVSDLAAADAGRQVVGRGLDGMRHRLESVGGRLEVHRPDETAGPVFTATAWIPVRSGG